MEPTAYPLSSDNIFELRKRFNKLNQITSFSSDIHFASLVACYGMQREAGTVNDELARFIFDANNGEAVRLTSLNAEIVKWGNLFGLHIWSVDTQRIELRTQGFYDVVHPLFSKNEDGSLHSLFIFPAIINEIARTQGVELVLVKSWGQNSIFGGFDASKAYYQTNFWELENNDSLLFADLMRQGKMAFLGTHDLIAHIAGINQAHIKLLKTKSDEVYKTIRAYFGSVTKPSISALILPYIIGVVLDDLAQPPSYNSPSHLAVLDDLMLRLSKREIPANLQSVLTRFPGSFQKIIELSRTAKIELNPLRIKQTVDSVIREIQQASFISG